MRATLLSVLLLTAACTCMTEAQAQYGGKQRGGVGGEPSKKGAARSETATKPTTVAPTDPMVAIEREMASLRVDLKLTAEQTGLFDSCYREVRNAARASTERTRQLSGFRLDDGSTVAATSIIATSADADTVRASSMREVGAKLDALIVALTPEQRKQLDQRVVEAMRDPLGNS